MGLNKHSSTESRGLYIRNKDKLLMANTSLPKQGIQDLGFNLHTMARMPKESVVCSKQLSQSSSKTGIPSIPRSDKSNKHPRSYTRYICSQYKIHRTNKDKKTGLEMYRRHPSLFLKKQQKSIQKKFKKQKPNKKATKW